MTRFARGTPAFRRANAALFVAGFATFTLLYCVQPLLPSFASEFGLHPAAASLSLSVSTLALGVGMVVWGPLSKAWGRKRVMAGSLALAALSNALAAGAGGYEHLLALRALEGLALGGVPAVAMAYLGEEFETRSLGYAMGLYVAGTGIGGMTGRLLTGIVADYHGWRAALVANGALGIAAAAAFSKALPASTHFSAQALRGRAVASGYARHFSDPGLRGLFATGFLAMGSFVSVYNYIAFRLLSAPYRLNQTAVGAVFLVYVVGIVAAAWAGRLADRFGRRRLLWIAVATELAGALLTLAAPLGLVVAGVAVLTFGFFATHSIASSWIARRALEARAQASSLYLFFYYLGSTVVGTLAGFAYAAGGWHGLVGGVVVLLAACLAVTLRLRALAPIATQSPPQALLA